VHFEGLRVSIRVSVVIRHNFHLRYACCFDGGSLVFENRQARPSNYNATWNVKSQLTYIMPEV